MKVLHITNAFPYEGHPEYGCFISEQIKSLDTKVQSEVLFVNAHKNGSAEYLKSLKKIREKTNDVDVIHCHHLFSYILYKLSFSKRKPVVLSFLNDWTKEIKLNLPEKLKHFICSFYIRKPDAVIFKSFIPKFLVGDKFVFLPNGVDCAYFDIIDSKTAKSHLGLLHDKNYILFVSSKNLYRHQKRYDIFNSVIKELQLKYDSYNYEPLTMSVDDRNTARNKINSASLHLLCSDYEGSPNSVKEALSSGIPVISRPAGSVEALLHGTPFTKLINSDNPSEIADAIHGLLQSKIDRTEIRSALLASGISKEEVADRLYTLYEKVLNSSNSSF